MGAAISKAANGIGGVIGNAFAAPFKTIFGGSCEDVCSGPWDVVCFIEHLCISNLVKLLMILGLCYITLMFLYLLFKVGICQCIGRSLCKMCWAACETYWFALQDITCFLWHKLKNTKRVNRRRSYFQDVEVGYSSSETSESSDNYSRFRISRNKKTLRERRKERLRRSLYPSNSHGHRHHHHVRLKTREVSVHVKGGSRSRQLQLSTERSLRKKPVVFKRKRHR